MHLRKAGIAGKKTKEFHRKERKGKNFSHRFPQIETVC